MSPVKIEAFLSIPPCSGGVAVRRILQRAQNEFGDRIEVIVHTGRDAVWDENRITTAPALVIGDLARFVGLAPSYQSLVAALREAGLE
ncbi:MAG TPA: hypothetical protein GX714_00810 [Chloroflexi bacterium]|jgi:hypothetical protein|nr:hypothetical protein [Chloroflexota bacterium]